MTPAGNLPELVAWLRLNLTHGLGPASTLNLLRALGTPEQVLAGGHHRVAQVVGAAIATRLLSPDDEVDRAVEQALHWASEPDHHLVTLADPAYPARLLQINDPPPLLYVAGDPQALAKPSIGVVGSRHATGGGLDNAREFSVTLASQGLTIVSGLARGIDTAAHLGAIDSLAGPSASTVAVMGTGIDRIYPAVNRTLAQQIRRRGAIITEMPLGTAALRGNFPRRNRLIAGLSLGVLVVEAARHSGSLITARLASEFGREVFAIPGSIHSPVARGCHQLIRQGAKLVESADDVLSELAALFSPGGNNTGRSIGQADPEPTAGLLGRIDWEPVTIDALLPHEADASQASELARELLELELAGQIERLPDGRVQRRKGL